MWSQSTDLLPDEMADVEDQSAALFAFYVRWDPYLGQDESWAPDYVPQQQQRRKFDREAARFRLPPPQPIAVSQDARDPDALARPSGPPEPHEEQDYLEATQFLRDADQVEMHLAATAPTPPPPVPLQLTPAQMALIAANRDAARQRRKARRQPKLVFSLPANWLDFFS